MIKINSLLIKSEIEKNQDKLKFEKSKILKASPRFVRWIARSRIVWPNHFWMSIECLGVGDSNDVFKYMPYPNRYRAMSWRNGGQGCQKFSDFGKLKILGDSWRFESWWTWYRNMLLYAIYISLEWLRGVESNVVDVLSSIYLHPNVMSWRNCSQGCQKFWDLGKLEILRAPSSFAWWIARNRIVWKNDFYMLIECLGVGDSNDIFKNMPYPNRFRAMSWKNQN